MTIRDTDVRVRPVDGDGLAGAELAVVFHRPDGRLDEGSASLLESLGVQPRDLESGGLLASRVHGSAVAPVVGRDRPLRLALVCVDPDADDALTEARDAATVAGRGSRDARRVAVAVPSALAGQARAVEALAEGFLLGSHRYERDGAAGAPRELELSVLGAEGAEDRIADEGVRGGVVADAANWVRDLVTVPPSEKTPDLLAEELRAVVAAAGGSVRIWTRDELEEAGFRGILAVGRGSQTEPAMVEIEYRGAEADVQPIALAGKGVTFDSGGLDLKPLESMYTMKCDMAGAASVAASLYAAGKRSLPINVHAAIPIVENMPGGNALRPGDVVRHWNGVTSEVVSPDAEGRLILADAMAYLASRGPRSLVAVSTLTGGTAVGADMWGVFAGAPELGAELVEAGLRAGEPGWQLPLWRPYRSYLDSQVADVKNISERMVYSVAGIIGSLFLGEFVPPALPWAHIDIAATVLRTRQTENDMWPAGATGSPSRALIRWLEGMAEAA